MRINAMTLLCVASFVDSVARAHRDAAVAAESGADIMEYRIDRLREAHDVQELVRRSPLPCIVTCRPTDEGGHSDLPETQRGRLLSAALGAGAAYLDIELTSYRRWDDPIIGKDLRGKRAILSFHDFRGRPDRLYSILAEMNEAAPAVSKLAWTARSIRDNLEAFEILQHRQRPTIALCMGEAGLISRILARKFGAFLTFAALDGDGGTAPGQIAVSDMKKLYRWDRIGPSTKVYGVVGCPVMHSMSPAIHNAAFDAIDFDGVYVPLLVQPGYESFKAFMESFLNFDGLDLCGLSVTIPHKENALRYLKEKGAGVDPLAESIGALNTIVIERGGTKARRHGGGSDEATKRRSDEGVTNRTSKIENRKSLRGFSTDYAAILDSITGALNIRREELAGRRVAVLGAGGTGRTAVAALAHYGADVTIFNRTFERAQALAQEFDGRGGRVAAASMERLSEARCDIYVNTTSVGMHPNVDASPLGEHPPRLSSDTLVFDTVYNPPVTKLLEQARSAGARTISGVEMFVRQAAGQFQAWTGREAPVDAMRAVINRRLGG
jgi:3-dehydroquinate dehydratase/shikimate dehydrogenase